MAGESAQSESTTVTIRRRRRTPSPEDDYFGGVDEPETKLRRLNTDCDNVDDSVPQNGHEKREDEPKEQPETDIEKSDVGSDEEAEQPNVESQTGSDTQNDKIPCKERCTIQSLQDNSFAKIQIVRDADKLELFGTLESIKWAERLIKGVIAEAGAGGSFSLVDEADAGGSPSLVARGLAASGGEKREIQVLVEELGSSSSIMSSSPLSKADPSVPSEGVVQVDEDYYLVIKKHDYFVSREPQKIPQGYFVKQLQCKSEGIRYFHVHKDGEDTYDIVMVGILNVIDSTTWIAGTTICNEEGGFSTLNKNIFLPPLALSFPINMTPTKYKSKHRSDYMAMLSNRLKCAFENSGYNPASFVFDEELWLSHTDESERVPDYISPHECDGCHVMMFSPCKTCGVPQNRHEKREDEPKEQPETDIEKSDVGSAEEAETGSDTQNDKVTCKERCTIQSLQDNSSAKIQIVSDADKVELFGTLESIKWAEKLIKDVIAEADAGGSRSLVDRLFGTVQPASGGEQHGIQVPVDEADAGGSPSLVARGLAASGGEKREIQVLVEKLGVVMQVDEDTYLGIDGKRDYFLSSKPQKFPKGYSVKLHRKLVGLSYFHVQKDGEGTYDIVMVGLLNVIYSTAWIAGETICKEEGGLTRNEDVCLPPLALSYPTSMTPEEYKSKHWSDYTAMLLSRLERAIRISRYYPALYGFDEKLCLSLTGETEPRNIFPIECVECRDLFVFPLCETCRGESLPPYMRPTCDKCDGLIIDGYCDCDRGGSDGELHLLPPIFPKCDECDDGYVMNGFCFNCDLDELRGADLSGSP